MTNEEIVGKILDTLGGKDNILSASNCQTRLRINVKDDARIDEAAVRKVETVLGIVHDTPNYIEVVVGPGKCRKYADICHDQGIPADAAAEASAVTSNWQENKAAVKAGQKPSKIREILKTFGQIFVPLIPGVIAAGLCGGIAALLKQIFPGFADNTFLNVLVTFLGLIQTAFLSYLTAWVGYRAAEQFGGTPILGGMLGLITGLDGINTISTAIGWFDEAQPLNAILRAGRGGVLATVLGVYIMVKIEKAIRKKMPDSVDIVFTPLLTLVITLIPYIFIIMPVCGLVSTGICWIVEQLCMNSNPIIRIIAGYISTALFLPLVAMGMHHGLVAIYSVQLEQWGYVTLYPALAMAGAGQVGAAIAIWRKAKKVGNTRIQSVIEGALPAGFLGIGEPLIYGVTLPMGKPFLTAGLGAGFGGAFVMLMQSAATSWGPSGLLAIPIMTAGPAGPIKSMVSYIIGLCIAYVGGFIVTNIVIKPEDVANV